LGFINFKQYICIKRRKTANTKLNELVIVVSIGLVVTG